MPSAQENEQIVGNLGVLPWAMLGLLGGLPFWTGRGQWWEVVHV